MRISRSTGYALQAVGYIAEHKDKKVVLSQEISKQSDIPLEYLLTILQQLVKAHLLHSKRGPHGGFSLAKPVNKITVLQIIEAVDGPLVNYLSLAEQTGKSKFGARADQVDDKAISCAKDVFGKATLSSLLTK